MKKTETQNIFLALKRAKNKLGGHFLNIGEEDLTPIDEESAPFYDVKRDWSYPIGIQPSKD